MTETNNSGFFGKIPIKGDFVSRHLPRSFVDPWDLWLQESIAASRTQLSNHWLESYLTSPIWRFALSSGICGDNAWIGLMIPSVDRVGRYFPLTLASSVDNTSSLLDIADQEEAWFSQAENIALSALDQNKTFDSFTEDIDKLELPRRLTDIKNNESPRTDSKNSDHWRITMPESSSISDNISSLTAQLLAKSFSNLSLWWTNGSEKVEPSILISNGLPPAQGFSALLTANWEHWGWGNIQMETPASATVSAEVANDDNNEITSNESSLITGSTIPL